MKTPLHAIHRSLGAKLVDFHGWEMPLQYKGILEEHQAVRHHAGIFDVSHMGRIAVQGKDAEKFCDRMMTNSVVGKKDGQAIYGVLCREDGTAIDDIIIFRHRTDKCSVISNASNRERVLEHLQTQASKGWEVTVSAPFKEEGILAIQGPKALDMAVQIFPDVGQLGQMESIELPACIVSRTGYTGEKGIEIFAPADQLVALWQSFTDKGAVPVGLGARDTLRLEKGYALYGHELSDTIAPTESVSAWAVKLKKEAFLGKEALLALESSPSKRHQYGIVLQDPGIARAEHSVMADGEVIGVVTSGTYSPSLKKSIALIMVSKKLSVGDLVDVVIRDKPCRAAVVPLPFL